MRMRRWMKTQATPYWREYQHRRCGTKVRGTDRQSLRQSKRTHTRACPK